jgi:hypothetical protein
MLMFRSAWRTGVRADRIHESPSSKATGVVDKHVYGLRLPWTLVRPHEGRDPRAAKSWCSFTARCKSLVNASSQSAKRYTRSMR